MTGAGGQEHRQPLRRARVGVVALLQLCHVRDEGGTERGGNADEDARAETRSVLPRL